MSFQTHGDYAARLRDSFARQQAMTHLGITLARAAAGAVDLAMPFDARLTQQHGFIHAGILTTALDTAAGFAAYSLMPDGAGVLTIELKTSLMFPAKGASFRFEGRVLKPGRTIIFTQARAFAEQESGAREIARLTATMMVVQGRAGITG
ncbi:PaaI family thioesterase [Aquicoccus sp. G2-2]|uniref:PaaI family thioesterase n=1 Tax=Aquicoccus sp. G2-2 TaxID=3092120 RepID=UPI002AE010AF|nr:PaaI family thioesterase [Aquicoccus sp. G2-2]MEA1112868.1 PaaI family thioesterase [Aquicoccus sp. G2-2]